MTCFCLELLTKEKNLHLEARRWIDIYWRFRQLRSSNKYKSQGQIMFSIKINILFLKSKGFRDKFIVITTEIFLYVVWLLVHNEVTLVLLNTEGFTGPFTALIFHHNTFHFTLCVLLVWQTEDIVWDCDIVWKHGGIISRFKKRLQAPLYRAALCWEACRCLLWFFQISKFPSVPEKVPSFWFSNVVRFPNILHHQQSSHVCMAPSDFPPFQVYERAQPDV